MITDFCSLIPPGNHVQLLNQMNKSPFDKIIDRNHTAALKWQKFPEDVIPMWVADMEFATPSVVTQALAKRIEHPIFGYTTAPQSLVDCVTKYCSEKHNWSIESECLYWIPGVLPALTAACRIAGAEGDEIIVLPPVYHPLLQIPEKIGRTKVDVAMNYTRDETNQSGTWSIDFESLETAFTSRTCALLLSSPHNPMGVMFSEEELYKLASLCAAHNVLLISDEIHCDLILSRTKKHIPTALAAREHHESVVTIMSPSKTFNLAGANCSFIHTTNEDVLQKITTECLYTVPLVPTLSYTAAEAAYSEGWEWHRELIEYLRSNHDYLHTAINDSEHLSMDKLDATYLAWINTEKLMPEDAFDFFVKAGVGFSPGSQFDDLRYQRLNFACSRTQLEEGVTRMLRAIENR